MLKHTSNHENLKTDYPSKPVCYIHLNTEAYNSLIWSHINLELCQDCIWKTRWQKGSVALFTEKTMALLNNHSNLKNLHWLRDDQRPIHKVLLNYKVGILCTVSATRITRPIIFYDKFRKTHWTNSWTIFENSSNHRRNKYSSSKMFQVDIQPVIQWLSNRTLFLWTAFKIIRYLKKIVGGNSFLFLRDIFIFGDQTVILHGLH